MMHNGCVQAQQGECQPAGCVGYAPAAGAEGSERARQAAWHAPAAQLGDLADGCWRLPVLHLIGAVYLLG